MRVHQGAVAVQNMLGLPACTPAIHPPAPPPPLVKRCPLCLLLPLQERAKAFSSYKDYMGKDITSLVILPVWIMQPFTMLQVGGWVGGWVGGGGGGPAVGWPQRLCLLADGLHRAAPPLLCPPALPLPVPTRFF